jgi:uncharacterized protein YdeI (YjbR/CyaY-like superfamily)
MKGNFNPEFDKYIAKSAEFARPMLVKLRKLFHQACPQVEEVMKWSFPHFDYKGPLGSMAAFKQHMSWGFWKAKLMKDPHGLLKMMENHSMGHGKVTGIAQLPSDKILLEYICEAVALNEQGVKAPAPKKKPRAELKAPDYFMAALKTNKKALATFEAFSPSRKREYIEWIVEAKQDATRDKRLAQAIEWMAEGKPRNWKYTNC